MYYDGSEPRGLSADRAERLHKMLVKLGADPDEVTREGSTKAHC